MPLIRHFPTWAAWSASRAYSSSTPAPSCSGQPLPWQPCLRRGTSRWHSSSRSLSRRSKVKRRLAVAARTVFQYSILHGCALNYSVILTNMLVPVGTYEAIKLDSNELKKWSCPLLCRIICGFQALPHHAQSGHPQAPTKHYSDWPTMHIAQSGYPQGPT